MLGCTERWSAATADLPRCADTRRPYRLLLSEAVSALPASASPSCHQTAASKPCGTARRRKVPRSRTNVLGLVGGRWKAQLRDEPAHHVQVLSRPHRRAERSSGSARGCLAVRIQPMPAHCKNGAHQTPARPRRRSSDQRGYRWRSRISRERAKILFATVTFRGGRWWVSLNVEAANLHRARQHPLRAEGDDADWVGADRGLSAFVVAATVDGVEVARSADAPKPLRGGMDRQRRMAKALSRKQKGSSNQRRAASKLGRHHHRIANVRRDFLHRVSNALVKTHDRLVLEDLNVSGMLKNHALPIGQGNVTARWGQTYSLRTPDLQAGGRATNARRREGAVQHPMRAGETSPDDVRTDLRAAPAAGTDDAREGRCRTLDKRSSARFRLSSL